MDSIASFTMATGGHYISMLPVLIALHDLFALQFLWWKMLWNPSILLEWHYSWWQCNDVSHVPSVLPPPLLTLKAHIHSPYPFESMSRAGQFSIPACYSSPHTAFYEQIWAGKKISELW